MKESTYKALRSTPLTDIEREKLRSWIERKLPKTIEFPAELVKSLSAIQQQKLAAHVTRKLGYPGAALEVPKDILTLLARNTFVLNGNTRTRRYEGNIQRYRRMMLEGQFVCDVPHWAVLIDETDLTIPDGMTRVLSLLSLDVPCRLLYRLVPKVEAESVSRNDGLVAPRTPGDILQRRLESDGIVCPCNMNKLTPVMKYLFYADKGEYVTAEQMTVEEYRKVWDKHEAGLKWLAQIWKGCEKGMGRTQVRASAIYMFERDAEKATDFVKAFLCNNAKPPVVMQAGTFYAWLKNPANFRAYNKDGSPSKGYGQTEATIFYASSHIMAKVLAGQGVQRVSADRNYFEKPPRRAMLEAA